MLYVDSETGIVRLTRGDTAKLLISIYDDISGSEYSMDENDTLRLTVKKSPKYTEELFQKVLVGSNEFKIVPLDTNDIPFGKYEYDVELTTSDGDVYTVIPPTTFEIMQEITY